MWNGSLPTNNYTDRQAEMTHLFQEVMGYLPMTGEIKKIYGALKNTQRKVRILKTPEKS